MAGDLMPDTRDRILEGALQALGRVGLRHLTMGEVSERSGVSRGTVYRYFPSKEDLLAVMAEYEQERFAEWLRQAVASRGEDSEPLSLEVVAGYVMGYLRRHPALTLLIDTEPAFVLSFLRRQLPVFHRICEELVAPAMENAQAVRDGQVTVAELNELLLRVVLCVFLVPGEHPAQIEGVLEGALDSIVRLAGAGSRSGAAVSCSAIDLAPVPTARSGAR